MTADPLGRKPAIMALIPAHSEEATIAGAINSVRGTRSRWARPAPLLSMRGVFLAVAAAALLAASPARTATTAHASTDQYQPVNIGITYDGLQDWLPPGGPGAGLPVNRIDKMKAQILASVQYWHANTARFQIVQNRLVGKNGNQYSAVYMQDIRIVTDYALGLGLTVVLNAQTEGVPGSVSGAPLPTHATRVFWQKIMVYYKNNPHVVFDLFNEPRYCTWGQWRAAMQGLYDYVRGAGAQNTVWVEGRWWGSTLAGVPPLHGKGIVYSYHHPGKPWPHSPGLPEGPELWNRAFGSLAARGIPVVDGEFTDYQRGYHFDHPATLVPEYLRYLASRHIGLTAWTLGLPLVMNSTSNLASATKEPVGFGQLVKTWFATMAR